MRKIPILLLSALLAVSCQDSINTTRLSGESRLVVYAFPTAGDTVRISVSATRPLNGEMPVLKNVKVVCATNGIADRMASVGDTIENGFHRLTFVAVGKHEYGDKVAISVNAAGFPNAMSTTTIPAPADIQTVKQDTVYYNGSLCTRLLLSFHPLEQESYYAVRLAGTNVEDGTTEFLEVETSAEPLLNNYSATRPDFDSWGEFYHQMYIFEGSNMGESTVTLHLNTPQQSWTATICPQLFTLSEEYYQLLRSLNNAANNELSRYGLSFTYSSYTNVIGGYGCVGGYAIHKVASQTR